MEEWENIYDNSDEYDEFDVDGIPEGCLACGGDFPFCKQGCPLFDDE